MRQFISILLLVLSFSSFAQMAPGGKAIKNIFLLGQVEDSVEYKPLEFVSVVLLDAVDSTVVAGCLTDSIGNFKLGPFAPKTYLMKLTFVGYKTKFINLGRVLDDTKEIKMGKISLRPLEVLQELGEVKVVGQMDVLKAGIDKKIYNVAEDMNNQGGNAVEVLNNVPSVEVDQDGNISLRGDGNVLILIDGRPSTLGGSPQAILRALPANSIERIEVVTNPSAKYDPDGTSGIINIVLKKNKLKGINGEVSFTGATGDLYQGSASISVRNNRFNVFGSYNVNSTESFREFDGLTTIEGANGSSTTLTQTRPGDGISNSHTARAGFDFNLKEDQNIGFSTTYNQSENFQLGLLDNELKNGDGEIIREWNRRLEDPEKSRTNDFNLFYKWKFKEDKGDFSFDNRFSNGLNSRIGSYLERYETFNGEADTTPFLHQRLSNEEETMVFSSQVDFSRIFAKRKIRIEAGAKQILQNLGTLSYSEQMNPHSGIWNADTLANFTYDYKEQITSTYFIFGQALGKFKYQVGVRPEYALQNPILISKDLDIRNDYFNLFPSAHIRYNRIAKEEIGLSFSRRINRARSGQLNPFTDYSDPNNLRTGNPYLDPEYINSLDLSYSLERKKWNFLASVFYRVSTGVIQRIRVFNGDNTSTVTFGNIDQSNSIGNEFVISYKPTKNFRNNLSINTDYIEFFDLSGNSNFTNSGFNYGLKYSGAFDFWKKTASIQANFRYNSPRITAQGVFQPRAAFDISGEKKWKDGKWTLGLRVSDLFNTQEFRYDLTQGNSRQVGRFKRQSQRFFVTLTYRFGKYEISKRGGQQDGRGGEGGGFDY